MSSSVSSCTWKRSSIAKMRLTSLSESQLGISTGVVSSRTTTFGAAKHGANDLLQARIDHVATSKASSASTKSLRIGGCDRKS